MNEQNKSDKSIQARREEEVLKFWQENNIFKKSLEKEAVNGEFVFYEGPPTANAKPALHHLEARAFKDVLPRYKTMQGFRVPRRAGWDTHGLPVELQIEKKLGFTHKKQIEEYGIAKFNQECKDSVFTFIRDWEDFTDRIGYWVDQENAYYTFNPSYMESLWFVLSEVENRGLLYKDYKVVPWCPRCGTTLASHELAQGYQNDKDLSVTAKFVLASHSVQFLRSSDRFGSTVQSDIEESNTVRVSFLAWTTTPWTLLGNVALAVGDDIEYVLIKTGEEYLILAKDRLEIISEDYEIVFEMKGRDLVGLEYEPPYPYLSDLLSVPEKEKLANAYKVYPADFVTTADGTGIVHTAVMYGADDFELGTSVGLPKFHTVDLEGKFVKGTDFLEGRFVKDEQVAIDIIKDLAHRGLLFKKEKYEHSYPHCWRCKTALIYYARDSWYIAMSKLRDKLVNENEKINWEPSHIKEGRFGEWLREVKDWAISRERYWGTPLPIWVAKDGERIVVDSIEALKKYSKGGKLPTNEKGELDLHRPYIDEIILEKNGKEFERVKDVMDVWFDSGSMPFAQVHYPFENKGIFDQENYPADFISEAIDQTRGWFYTLHAVGVLMGKGRAYKNVICLGHLLDKEGKKMSKSIGNIVEPYSQIEKFGADTVRLWMYSVNQPGESKNYDEKNVRELQRQVFGLLYNVLAFYELYRDPDLGVLPPSNNVLDVWISTRLDQLIVSVTDELDNYRLMQPVRDIRAFIDDLSTWYLRRSRDRIKDGDTDAKSTLYRVLKTLSQILAPFAPFASEDIWQTLKNNKDVESVHLSTWPLSNPVDDELLKNMEMVRDICTQGNALRKKEGVPVRQPLARLSVSRWNLDDQYKNIVMEELNIKDVVVGSEPSLDTTITADLKAEGNYRELIRAVQDMRKSELLEPSDIITLVLSPNTQEFIAPFLEDLKKTVQAKEVVFSDNDGQEIKIAEVICHISIEE